jgi:hypothetical protein
MKKYFEQTKSAKQKAQSGQLIVNSSEVNDLQATNVSMVPRASLIRESNGEEETGISLKTETSLSKKFQVKGKQDNKDDIGIWFLAMMAIESMKGLPSYKYELNLH